MRLWATWVAGVAFFACLADARAWEGETTHAGLAERSALASQLADTLTERFELDLGLFEQLAMSPAEAPRLFEALATLNPTHGFAPGPGGELTALGWLMAGAVIADFPVETAIHHAYDPFRQAGFSSATLPALALGHKLRARIAGARLSTKGMPATEWLVHPDNPFGVAAFFDQYEQAVSASSPAARRRHAAAMLVAAGAILHVVQDTGSPERARNDRAAMLRRVGPDGVDVGSRLERLASLSFGRLGVPKPAREVPLRQALDEYITSASGDGLADISARSMMSPNTLPRTIDATAEVTQGELARRVQGSVRRPSPVPGVPFDLRAAASPDGARLESAGGVCIAHYELRDRELRWRIPDSCALDQLAAILAETSAHGAGVLEWLFRGELDVRLTGGAVQVASADLGVREARITLYYEDADGVRTPFAELESASGGAGTVLARAALPEGVSARRVVAVARGLDEHGQPLAASGSADL